MQSQDIDKSNTFTIMMIIYNTLSLLKTTCRVETLFTRLRFSTVRNPNGFSQQQLFNDVDYIHNVLTAC